MEDVADAFMQLVLPNERSVAYQGELGVDMF
jgi:hypothetical protein